MLLLCNDIEIKNNRYDLKHHKSKRVYNILAILMKYTIVTHWKFKLKLIIIIQLILIKMYY